MAERLLPASSSVLPSPSPLPPPSSTSINREKRFPWQAALSPPPAPRHWKRYGSAQVGKRQRQLYAGRTAHYEELKELQQERRETYQNDAVSVFAEHGIAYEVRGHSWLCQVGAEAIYYWPKSGR